MELVILHDQVMIYTLMGEGVILGFFTTISKLENCRFQVFEKKKLEFEMG
jgi:hypothetical protein